MCLVLLCVEDEQYEADAKKRHVNHCKVQVPCYFVCVEDEQKPLIQFCV